jgi:hypothetical protein
VERLRAKSGTGGERGTNNEQSFALVYVAKLAELSQGSAHNHIRTRHTSESQDLLAKAEDQVRLDLLCGGRGGLATVLGAPE